MALRPPRTEKGQLLTELPLFICSEPVRLLAACDYRVFSASA
jgi:hypothetical protein